MVIFGQAAWTSFTPSPSSRSSLQHDLTLPCWCPANLIWLFSTRRSSVLIPLSNQCHVECGQPPCGVESCLGCMYSILDPWHCFVAQLTTMVHYSIQFMVYYVGCTLTTADSSEVFWAPVTFPGSSLVVDSNRCNQT